MQRTINEIHELIQQKRQNAFNDLLGVKPHTPSEHNKLLGEIEAYDDVLWLIETSRVLEKED